MPVRWCATPPGQAIVRPMTSTYYVIIEGRLPGAVAELLDQRSVSYTHLTLPTTPYV